MISLLGVLSNFGRLLPGYIEGERAAIKDNWTDELNFNTVLHGNLQNAFDVQTYPWQLQQAYNQSQMIDDQGLVSAMNTNLQQTAFPYQQRMIPVNFSTALNNMAQQQQTKAALSQILAGMNWRSMNQQPAVPIIGGQIVTPDLGVGTYLPPQRQTVQPRTGMTP